MMAPKHKRSDAGNSDMPTKSCKVLHLNEKVKVLDLRKGKNHTVFTKIYDKNKSVKLKKEKEFVLVLLSHLKLQKLWPQCVMFSLGRKGIKFVYVCNRKKYVICGVWYYLKFQTSAGGLGMYPPWIV